MYIPYLLWSLKKNSVSIWSIIPPLLLRQVHRGSGVIYIYIEVLFRKGEVEGGVVGGALPACLWFPWKNKLFLRCVLRKKERCKVLLALLRCFKYQVKLGVFFSLSNIHINIQDVRKIMPDNTKVIWWLISW